MRPQRHRAVLGGFTRVEYCSHRYLIILNSNCLYIYIYLIIRFILGSADKTCIIWDLNRFAYVRALGKHEGPITVVAVSPTTVTQK
jgi:hypothetical protein